MSVYGFSVDAGTEKQSNILTSNILPYEMLSWIPVIKSADIYKNTITTLSYRASAFV